MQQTLLPRISQAARQAGWHAEIDPVEESVTFSSDIPYGVAIKVPSLNGAEIFHKVDAALCLYSPAIRAAEIVDDLSKANKLTAASCMDVLRTSEQYRAKLQDLATELRSLNQS